VTSASVAAAETVLGWGQDSYGQLGDGSDVTAQPAMGPVSLPPGTQVTGIAGGYDHSLAVTSAGGVLAFGHNYLGQLGDGTITDSNVPVAVSLPSGARVTQAAAGFGFSLAVTSRGGVLAWGDNGVGELGDGQVSRSPVTTPVPVALPRGTTVTQVAASTGDWALALTSAGQVLAWGDNFYGDLGNGTVKESDVPVRVPLPAGVTVIQVAAGAATGYALTSAGTVYAWGSGADGALGNGSTANSATPVAVAIPQGTRIFQVSSYGSFALALATTGRVLAWGHNSAGQLGDGSTADSDVPVAVKLRSGTIVAQIAAGGQSGLAVTLSGSLLAWGDGTFGELGAGPWGNGGAASSDVPVSVEPVPPGTRIEAVAAGQVHALALLAPPPRVTDISPEDGLPAGGGFLTITGSGFTRATAVVFGATRSRAWTLLSDSEIIAEIPAGSGRVDVTVTTALGGTSAASSADQYIFLAKGSLLTWGNNDAGQLGNGSAVSSDVPVAAHLPAGTVVTATATGKATTYALTSTGAVYAWGDGTYGQLGDGSFAGSALPVRVHFPAGTVITAIAAGYYNGFALSSTDQVFAWGYGGYGDLGDGSTSNSAVPVQVALPFGTAVTAIAGGYYDAYARTSTGTVLAWGYGHYGQLGNGATHAYSTVPVAVKLAPGTKVAKIAAGGADGYALTTAGHVLAWGYGFDGELGNGTKPVDSDVPVAVKLPTGTTVIALAGEMHDGLAVTRTGELLAWGNNHFGELGDGSTASSDVPVAVRLPAGLTIDEAGSGYAEGDGAVVSPTGFTLGG
jgi:alpha-tubulin suppressor-like RCC1 family protein